MFLSYCHYYERGYVKAIYFILFNANYKKRRLIGYEIERYEIYQDYILAPDYFCVRIISPHCRKQPACTNIAY